MKNYNLIDALNVQQEGCKIIKILSNKFAIIKPVFTNGSFDDERICGLDNGVIKFYGYLAGFEDKAKMIYEFKNHYIYFDDSGRKFHKYNKIKSTYRKSLKLINN